MVATATPRLPPTRTPRETPDPVDMEDTRVASLPPRLGTTPEPDDYEPNDTTTTAQPLLIGDQIDGLTLHNPRDVDVFSIPVDEADMVLVVTLTGRTLGRYSMNVSSPTRSSAGRIRYDGTTALRGVADVGADTGTYFAFIRSVGAVPPEGTYSIAASLVPPALTPTATP